MGFSKHFICLLRSTGSNTGFFLCCVFLYLERHTVTITLQYSDGNRQLMGSMINLWWPFDSWPLFSAIVSNKMLVGGESLKRKCVSRCWWRHTGLLTVNEIIKQSTCSNKHYYWIRLDMDTNAGLESAQLVGDTLFLLSFVQSLSFSSSSSSSLSTSVVECGVVNVMGHDVVILVIGSKWTGMSRRL